MIGQAAQSGGKFMRKMIMIMPLAIVTMMTLRVAMMGIMKMINWASCAEWRQVHEEGGGWRLEESLDRKAGSFSLFSKSCITPFLTHHNEYMKPWPDCADRKCFKFQLLFLKVEQMAAWEKKHLEGSNFSFTYNI